MKRGEARERGRYEAPTPLVVPGATQSSDGAATALLDPARTSEILRRQPLEPDADDSLDSLDAELDDITVRGPAELAKRQLLVKPGHVLAGLSIILARTPHPHAHTHTQTHTRTHARARAHTHTHLPYRVDHTTMKQAAGLGTNGACTSAMHVERFKPQPVQTSIRSMPCAHHFHVCHSV